MGALRIVLTIIFILVSVVLATIVLMQEGKSAGLGVISGAADTYWGKNKGRSLEGKLEKITKILAVVFMLMAIILNMNIF
ncbi:MAG: preprotein translocase subunit SecG [Lachnospiraceae bacterium]|nr:preprotein translocase subunit SecG [Lachnospiraceae bacterium]